MSPAPIQSRLYSVLMSCALSIVATVPIGCAAAPLTLTKRSTTNFPSQAADQNNQSFTVTGVSSITYLDPRRGFAQPAPNQHAFIAALDNSNKLIQFNISFNPDASIASLTLSRGMILPETHDNEAIACTNSVRNSVFLANEDQPGINEYSLNDFQVLSRLRIPQIYTNRRTNFGFESMSLQEGEQSLYFANEEALTTDGPVSTSQAGTLVRIQRYRMSLSSFGAAQYLPNGQFAYRTQPIHGATVNGARSGLCELVALPNGKVLALERSFALSLMPFQTRIYELDFQNATDTTDIPSLTTATIIPISKRQLYQTTSQTQLGNLEGLCFGPNTGPNSWALVGVLDDGDPLTTNQIITFELKNLTAPPPSHPTPTP